MAVGTQYDFWPDWMPAPQDTLSFQIEDLRETTETEVGAIIRPQFRTDVLVADCTLVLNRMQSAWFEAFERFANHEGFWFHFPLWYGGDVRIGLCTFKDRLKWTVEAFTTTYKFNLLVKERSLMLTPCAFEMLECWTPVEVAALASASSEAVNALDLATGIGGY